MYTSINSGAHLCHLSYQSDGCMVWYAGQEEMVKHVIQFLLVFLATWYPDFTTCIENWWS